MNDYGTIRANTRWFLKHSDHWDRVSDKAMALARECDAIVIPAGTLDWPGFQGYKAVYTKAAQKVVDQYLTGSKATKRTAELLDESARLYADLEAENTELTNKLLKELKGEF